VCGAEIMTLVRTPAGLRIDLRGLSALEVPAG
jgi:hypothetical protein